MIQVTRTLAVGVAFAALIVALPVALAYERYNDGCQDCHGGFTDDVSTKGSVFPGDDKHNMHNGNSAMNADCDLCHTQGDGRDPFIGSSNGTNDNPGLGCIGCHNAPGLRAHHAVNSVTTCAPCHQNDPTPPPESSLPTYYGTVDTNTNEPCNAVASSNLNENWTVGDFVGLDNDGDGLYDANDPDCATAVCGNGALEAGEECDDGNTLDGDCCSSTCTLEPSGSSCDDGLFCSVGETCDGAGACAGGSLRDCSDGVSCTLDSCDEGADSCVNSTDDTACDDGLFCNGAESCDPALDCQAGTVVDCDDGVACTVDGCDEGSDSCTNTADDGACDDGLFCNGSESCDPALDCQAGSVVNCDDGVGCTVDECDETSDSCANTPDDGACDDGLFCNGSESCDPALDCQPGTVVDCSDGVACTVDGCDENSDICTNTPDDGVCDDGLFCTGVELCDPALDCQVGTPVDCDDSDICTDDNCDEAADRCDNVFDPTNDPSCLTAECGNGQIEVGEDCDDGNVLDGDCCSAVCSFEASGSSCDDGQFCTVGEVCDGTGACGGGSARGCDDGVGCTTDSCDEGADACVNTADDASCDDGLFCNGTETCDPALDCQAGTAVDCDDGVGCTTDGCDEATDACTHTADDGVCDDGLFCNGAEFCDPALDCQAGTLSCDDGVGCTLDECDEPSDSCTHTPDNGACDDGLFCNGAESCDAALDCRAGTAVDCDDGVGCTLDGCDEAADACTSTPEDSACDDGEFCNGAETCDPALDCQNGTTVDCDDGVGCTTDSCDEAADACLNDPDDASCDDGIFCNGAESCDPTLDCQSGAAVDCDDGEVCTDDECNESTDSCDNVFDPTNAPECDLLCPDEDSDGYSAAGGGCGVVDCDDTDPTVNPGAAEVCDDYKDNNCDGLVDAADAACEFDAGSWTVRSGPLVDPDYTGSETCGGCHELQFENWKGSLHARILVSPGDAQAAGFALPDAASVPGSDVSIDSWADVLFVTGQKWRTVYVDRQGNVQGAQWNYLEADWNSHASGQIAGYDCGQCHTTGYNADASYIGDQGQTIAGIVGSWVEFNIGCEACHGPGAAHAAAPSSQNINQIVLDWTATGEGIRTPLIRSAEVCGNCHYRDPSHYGITDSRRRNQTQFSDWSAGPHASSLEPEAVNTYCAKCHSPGNAVYDAAEHHFTNFEPGDATQAACISCHDPHLISGGRWSTLQWPSGGQQDPKDDPARLQRYLGTDSNPYTADYAGFENSQSNQLCVDCHTEQPGFRLHVDASPPPVVILEPPYNDDQPLDVPHGEHVELGYANCVDCHMAYTRTSINSGDVRTHSLLPNEWGVGGSAHYDDTCGQCHSEARDCSMCHSDFAARMPMLRSESENSRESSTESRPPRHVRRTPAD